MPPEVNEPTRKALEVIKGWANLKASEYPLEWSEDDELQYRSMFGESLTVLPDERK
ncbi:hypothetical protein [Enterococcus avium]|uniref:hypothetical protein n=1 Tax=Enterococcus TaxID=1350 RepID=UPI00130D9031|nr:hypothetical protein [Enterococcus avium]